METQLDMLIDLAGLDREIARLKGQLEKIPIATANEA